MEVKIEVGEHEVVHLKPGQPAEVGVDALEGETFQGSVVEIAQKALIKNPGTEAGGDDASRSRWRWTRAPRACCPA